jgi:F420-dependent oxidoreductase-like protein
MPSAGDRPIAGGWPSGGRWPIEVCVFTEPQMGATYDQLVTLARTAQDGGWDGFFRSDHYLTFGGDGLPGPSDAWLTLAGLARDTDTLRLGTLVSPATFREPAVLALQVAQVDQMSGGRVELGLGAGWFEAEHHAFGLAFGSVKERFDRFEEQLEIVTSLWALDPGQTYDVTGAHYTLVANPGLPKPVQARIPLIIGGNGKVRTPQLAARFATEFNTGFGTVANAAALYARVREACEKQGRDADTLRLSWAGPTIVGRDHDEQARRAAAAGLDLEEVRATSGIAGTPAEVVERLRALVGVGTSRFYLQLLDLDDLAHADLISEQVLPALRG